MPQEISVKIENLCYSVNNKSILDNLCLDIYKGEILGLLGPNGTGKTTLLSLLTGLKQKKSGSIMVGKSTSAKDWRGLIGLVPQEYSFYMEYTVRQNLELFGSLYDIPSKELRKRMDDFCKWIELEGYLDIRAKYLSGGYKRMLNLGCSILHDPDVIYLDEPTVGLDPYMRHLTWEKIKDLRNRGKTVVITTHYMTEAEDLCDRVAIFSKGKILTIGNTQDMIREHGGYRIATIKLSRLPSEYLPKLLEKDFKDIEISIEGTYLKISFHSEKSIEELAAIIKYVNSQGYEIEYARIKEPKLEDVFLRLTKGLI